MTRILFWNIQNFNTATIHNPADPNPAAWRLQHIQRIVADAAPDLFVVVECYARNQELGGEGKPIADDAAERLRLALPGPWALVPPLKLGWGGFQEGVAVFYRTDRLQFGGPYVWGTDYRTVGTSTSGSFLSPAYPRACPAANSMLPAGYPAAWAGTNGPQTYGGSWSNSLPARAVPGLGLQENHLAGQWQFHTAAGAPIGFPSEFNRSPFLTRFQEIAAPHRVLNLYSMHTSPEQPKLGTLALADIPEIAAAPGANQVTVIVGDFNVDTFSGAAEAYTPLLNLNYDLLFDSRAAGNVDAARKPYLFTHLLPTAEATPFSAPGPDPRHNPYPRYGYMGSMGGAHFSRPVDTGAIDNILVRYGAGLAMPGAGYRASVLNPVVGTPYADPAGAGFPVSPIACTPRMANAIPRAPPWTDPKRLEPARFQEWRNFGHIRGTSDHLALAADI